MHSNEVVSSVSRCLVIMWNTFKSSHNIKTTDKEMMDTDPGAFLWALSSMDRLKSENLTDIGKNCGFLRSTTFRSSDFSPI